MKEHELFKRDDGVPVSATVDLSKKGHARVEIHNVDFKKMTDADVENTAKSTVGVITAIITLNHGKPYWKCRVNDYFTRTLYFLSGSSGTRLMKITTRLLWLKRRYGISFRKPYNCFWSVFTR